MNINSFNSLERCQNFITRCNQLLSPSTGNPPPTPADQEILNAVRVPEVSGLGKLTQRVFNFTGSLISPIHRAARASSTNLATTRILDRFLETFSPLTPQEKNVRSLAKRVLMLHPDESTANSLVALFQNSGAKELIDPFNQALTTQRATDKMRLGRLSAPEHTPAECFEALSSLHTPDGSLTVDGQQIPLFNCLLEGRSAYFKNLHELSSSYSSDDLRKDLTDAYFGDPLPSEAYPTFFAYLYTGMIDQRYALELRDFADFFQVSELKEACQSILEGKSTRLVYPMGTEDLIGQAKQKEFSFLNKNAGELTESEKRELKDFVAVCDRDGKIVVLLHKALCPPQFLPSIDLKSSPEKCVICPIQKPLSNEGWADIRRLLYLNLPYNPAIVFSFEILELLLTEYPHENLVGTLDLEQISVLLKTARLISKTLDDPKESKNILRKAQALSLVYLHESTGLFDNLVFLQAISHFKHPTNAHFTRLETLTRDQDASVRRSVSEALGAIGGAEALRLLGVLTRDQDAHVRFFAAKALGAIGGDEALRLLEVLAEDQDAFVRHSVAKALGAIGGDKALRLLGVLTRDQEASVRCPAAEALGIIGGGEALRLLLVLVRDRDADVQHSVAKALGAIGGDETLRFLRVLTRNQDASVRRLAAEALGVIGGGEALRLLEVLAEDRDAHVRCSVAEALGAIGGDEALRLLGALTRDQDARVRCSVAEALGAIGGDEALRLLGVLTRDQDAGVRFFAAKALGAIGGGEALRLLGVLAEDQDIRVRQSAADALGAIGGDEALRILGVLAGPKRHPQCSVVGALGAIGDDEAIRLLWVLARYGSDNHAVKVLFNLGDFETLKILQALFRNSQYSYFIYEFLSDFFKSDT